MFKKILIANRGEIALRIIRTCREMDIETVAIYSTADAESLHVKFATQSVCVGSHKSSDSYLNVYNILSAAIATGCDAIHPGFGFLSENAEFARLCAECQIEFIGPSAEVISKMGNKSQARSLMIENVVPVVPGSQASVQNIDELKALACDIGYPVLIKAAAGGGGRGMRRVYSKDMLEHEYLNAKAEAKACFGDDEMYLEKLIVNPKHIEFQVLADKYGNVIHLGERECSVQRKNQKMIEESPSKAIDEELRQKMGEAAVRATKAANYCNAGTIEFVLSEEGKFYFIEMNTRIQVEHPVTEMVSGLDLIREQIKIASGLKLKYTQDDIELSGHSIECRINAENPIEGFMANSGKIDFMHFPNGNRTRVDSALYTGYEVSPFYDSMIAKVIVHAPTRLQAIRKMRRALEEMIIEGIETNISLQHLIMFHPTFLKGSYTTSFIEDNLEELLEFDKNIAAIEE